MEKKLLDMMDEFHPDLVISDIKEMPFMDGLELAKNIHENYVKYKGDPVFPDGMILHTHVWLSVMEFRNM